METSPTFVFEGNWITTILVGVALVFVGYKMYKAWKKLP